MDLTWLTDMITAAGKATFVRLRRLALCYMVSVGFTGRERQVVGDGASHYYFSVSIVSRAPGRFNYLKLLISHLGNTFVFISGVSRYSFQSTDCHPSRVMSDETYPGR